MTLSHVQTAIKHQHLASRKIKMQQEETAAGERNHWETHNEMPGLVFPFPLTV